MRPWRPIAVLRLVDSAAPVGVDAERAQGLADMGRRGPEGLRLAVDVDGDLAAVLHRDPRPVGRSWRPAAGATTSRSPTVMCLAARRRRPCRAAKWTWLGDAVDRQGDVLVEASVGERSARDGKSRRPGDDTGMILRTALPTWSRKQAAPLELVSTRSASRPRSRNHNGFRDTRPKSRENSLSRRPLNTSSPRGPARRAASATLTLAHPGRGSRG